MTDGVVAAAAGDEALTSAASKTARAGKEILVRTGVPSSVRATLAAGRASHVMVDVGARARYGRWSRGSPMLTPDRSKGAAR